MATIYLAGRPTMRLPGPGPSPLVPRPVRLLSLSPIIGALVGGPWAVGFSSDFGPVGFNQADQTVSASAYIQSDPGYRRVEQAKIRGPLAGRGPNPLVPKSARGSVAILPVFADLGGSVGITQDNQTLIASGTVISADPGWNRPSQISLPGRRDPGRGPAPLIPRAIMGVFPLIVGTIGVALDDQTVSASAYVPFDPGYRRAPQPRPGRLAGNGPIPLVPLAVQGQLSLQPVLGAVSATQDDETLSATVTISVDGALSPSQNDHTVSSAGSIVVSGTLSSTQDGNTLISTTSLTSDPGYWRVQPRRQAPGRGPRPVVPRAAPAPATMSPVFGTLAIAQDNQSESAVATVAVSGALTAIQTDQALSAVASPAVAASLSILQGDGTLSATIYLTPDPGYWLHLITRPGQRSPARGPRPVVPTAVSAPATMAPVFGTLAATQDNQSISGIAGALLAGLLSKTQADHTISASASSLLSASLTVTQDSQSISALVAVRIGASLSVAQNDQTIVSAAIARFVGSLSVEQSDQVVVAAGGPVVSGALSKSQSQTITAVANVLDSRASLAVTQNSQSLAAGARSIIGGALVTTQASQRLSSSVSLFPSSAIRRVVQIAPDSRIVEILPNRRVIQIAPDSRLFIVPAHT